MKRIILTVVLMAGFAASAQKGGEINYPLMPYPDADTLMFVKTFETNKAKYIGKPFSVILNDLGEMQPKTVIPASGASINDLSKSPATFFNFKGRSQMYDTTAINLFIDWQTPLPRDEVYYYRKKNDAHFTEEERAYYSTKIVKDVSVFRTNNK